MAERAAGRIEKYRSMSKAELETAATRACRTDFPPALSSSRPGRSEGLKKLREAKRKDFARVKTLLREAELRKA